MLPVRAAGQVIPMGKKQEGFTGIRKTAQSVGYAPDWLPILE